MTAPNAIVRVGSVEIGNAKPLSIIAGPCALESRDHALEMASALKEIAAKAGVGLIYKTSFDKANRTSANSARGLGLELALPIFAEIRERLGVPVLTDVHEREQCASAGRSGRRAANSGVPLPPDRPAGGRGRNRQRRQRQEGPVPRALGHEERHRQGHGRGQSQRAGHRARRLVRLQHAGLGHARAADPGAFGAPVVFDATHSVQQPGGQGTSSGGERDMVPVLARAAVAIGVAAVFMETHQDPDRAPSDGPNMLKLKDVPALLSELVELDRIAKKRVAGNA